MPPIWRKLINFNPFISDKKNFDTFSDFTRTRLCVLTFDCLIKRSNHKNCSIHKKSCQNNIKLIFGP